MANKATFKINDTIPSCISEGCENPRVAMMYLPNGKATATHVRYRPVCNKCHNKRTVSKHDGCKNITDIVAKNAGFKNTSLYQASRSRHLKHRKTYCENIDGRLGFTCNTVLPTEEMLLCAGINLDPMQFLEVDHIDGNHLNNNKSNLQTLCKHCHVIKGIQNGDAATPGRKTRVAEAA